MTSDIINIKFLFIFTCIGSIACLIWQLNNGIEIYFNNTHLYLYLFLHMSRLSCFNRSVIPNMKHKVWDTINKIYELKREKYVVRNAALLEIIINFQLHRQRCIYLPSKQNSIKLPLSNDENPMCKISAHASRALKTFRFYETFSTLKGHKRNWRRSIKSVDKQMGIQFHSLPPETKIERWK